MIGDRLRARIDSIGPALLWILVAVAATVVLCGAFVGANVISSGLVINARPSVYMQTPWLFVLFMTCVTAIGSKALLRSSEEVWRAWLLRIGLPVVLLCAVVFLVAHAQATSGDYIFFAHNGALIRPAFPYIRAVFAAFALIAQLAILVRLRGNTENVHLRNASGYR